MLIIEEQLASIMPYLVSVWSHDEAGNWHTYIPGGPTPGLTELVDGREYTIKVTAPCTINYGDYHIELPNAVTPTNNVWNTFIWQPTPPGFWDQYKWYVIGGGVGLLALLVLIGVARK